MEELDAEKGLKVTKRRETSISDYTREKIICDCDIGGSNMVGSDAREKL